MNRVIKSAIGVAIAAASSGAYAQMAPISSGGSDLVLWVQGTNTSGTTSTYAFDTGLSISSIFGTTFTPGASLTPLRGTAAADIALDVVDLSDPLQSLPCDR